MSPQLINARCAVGVYFGFCGFVLGIWAVNIPQIRDRVGLSLHEIGLVLLLFGASAFVSMAFSGRVIDRCGSRAILIGSGIGMSISIAGPAFAQNKLQLMVAIVVLGLGNGFLDASQNVQAVEVERAYARPIMSTFHALFSIGSLAAAVIGALLLAADVDIRAVFAGVGLAGLGVVATSSRHLMPHQRFDASPNQGTNAAWSAQVFVIGSVAFALFMAEGVAFDWSSLYLRDVLEAEKSVAAFGFGAFSMTMLAVRLVADRIIERVGSVRYVRAGTIVAGAGMCLAIVSSTVPVAILAFSIFALGVAGCAPQIFSAAGRIGPGGSSANISRVVALGYVGHLAGPSIVGFLAEQTSLRIALVAPAVCCLYAYAMARRALR